MRNLAAFLNAKRGRCHTNVNKDSMCVGFLESMQGHSSYSHYLDGTDSTASTSRAIRGSCNGAACSSPSETLGILVLQLQYWFRSPGASTASSAGSWCLQHRCPKTRIQPGAAPRSCVRSLQTFQVIIVVGSCFVIKSPQKKPVTAPKVCYLHAGQPRETTSASPWY